MHGNIDQAFSKTLEWLWSSEAVIIYDLHTELWANYGGAPAADSLMSDENWSSLSNQKGSLQKLPVVPHLCQFRFTAKQIDV